MSIDFHSYLNRFCTEIEALDPTSVLSERDYEKIKVLAQAILGSKSSLNPEEVARLNSAQEKFRAIPIAGYGKDTSSIEEVFALAFPRAHPAPLSAAPRSALVDPTSKRIEAILAPFSPEKIGYKAATLRLMQELFAEDKGIVIPAFESIDHDTIFSYLNKRYPAFLETWKSYLSLRKSDPVRACSLLKELQTRIEKAFSESPDFPPHELLTAFADLPIMVRSTGKEDSVSLANPGGNESVGNVTPTREEVCKAIGCVIASYFSEKSLSQRELLGDDISAMVFMPSLLQVMIGETPGSMIPTSGVLYTREADLDTEGIVQICSTFGHAESVVTGSDPCDTFYVQGEYVHAVLSQKKRRKAPGESGKLIAKDNPKSLQFASSLTEGTLQRLASIARRIEAAYGCSVDVEWSYDPKTDTIYLFQARPIPKRPPSTPSYLNPAQFSSFSMLQKVIIHGAAGGEVKTLTKANTLIERSIVDALHRYLAHPEPKPTAVLIGTPTAANSHEAGFFRSLGVPILQVEEKHFQELSSQLATHPLLVDVQQGLLGALKPDTKAEEVTVLGLKRFLAPHAESFMASSLTDHKLNEFREELKVYASSANRTETVKAIQATPGLNTIDQLLNYLESAPSAQERAFAIHLLLRTVEKKLLRDLSSQDSAKILRKITYNLHHFFTISCEVSADENKKKFAMNWVRAALLDLPAKGVVDADSLLSLLGAKKELSASDLEVLSASSVAATEALSVFLRAKKFFLQEKDRNNWQLFLKELEPLQIQQLSQLFATLGPSIVETYLNTDFHKSWNEETSDSKKRANDCLSALCTPLSDPKTKTLLQKAAKLKEIAETFTALSGEFGNPKKCDALLERIDKELMPAVQESLLTLEEGKGIVALVHAEAFTELVACFDACIKGLTTSTEYADEALKVKKAATIVKKYVECAIDAMGSSLIVDDWSLTQQATVLVCYVTGRKTYILDEEARKNPRLELLQPSRGFNVGAVALGSGNLLPARTPILTIEDLFTTAHQTLLTIAACASKLHGIQQKDLPKEAQKVCDALEILDLTETADSRGLPRYPTIQGIHYHFPHLCLLFNAALRNHSAQLAVDIKLSSTGKVEAIFLEGRFVAPPNSTTADRAELISTYLRLCYHDPELPPDPDIGVPANQGNYLIARWQLFPGEKDLDFTLKKGAAHLQKVIFYLQGKGLQFDELESYKKDRVAFFKGNLKLLGSVIGRLNPTQFQTAYQLTKEQTAEVYSAYFDYLSSEIEKGNRSSFPDFPMIWEVDSPIKKLLKETIQKDRKWLLYIIRKCEPVQFQIFFELTDEETAAFYSDYLDDLISESRKGHLRPLPHFSSSLEPLLKEKIGEHACAYAEYVSKDFNTVSATLCLTALMHAHQLQSLDLTSKSLQAFLDKMIDEFIATQGLPTSSDTTRYYYRNLVWFAMSIDPDLNHYLISHKLTLCNHDETMRSMEGRPFSASDLTACRFSEERVKKMRKLFYLMQYADAKATKWYADVEDLFSQVHPKAKS